MTFFTSSIVLAQDNKYYLGLEAGYADADTGADETAQYLSNLVGQTVSYSYDDSAGVGRIFMGYELDRSIAFEVGVFATGDSENTYSTSGGAGTGSAVEDFSAKGLDVSFIFKPTETGLFARLGGHYSEVDSTAAVTFGSYNYSLSASGWSNESGSGLLGGLGYDYDIGENNTMTLRASYTYYNSLGGISGADMHTFNIGILF